MKKIFNISILLTIMLIVSCKETNSNPMSNQSDDILSNNEYLKHVEEQEKRIAKTRELMGLINLDQITPTSKSDIYFRSIKYLPFNRPIEIKTITNIGIVNPTINKKVIQFDYECNHVSGNKKLNEDCFKIISDSTERIKSAEVDSLIKLLDRTEFWNLRRSTYNNDEEVIFDGISIEFSGIKGKSIMGFDSIGIHKNLIERTIPERYLGIKLIDNYLNELTIEHDR